MLDNITVNEHSSIRIEDKVIACIDPFRLKEARHDADLILFTHPHFDHFSPEDFYKAAKPDTLFVCPLSMKREALEAGIAPAQLRTLEAEENLGILGIEIEGVPAYNTNKPNHPKEKGWLGYVLEIGPHMVYVAGDTDRIPEGEAVQCDVALVPIGGTYTMDAAEAAAFVNAMRPHAVIPTHYGSIVGSLNDAREFVRRLDRGIEVCLKIG
ncbi:MAG: MBL fold metallo-hydrolase [Oscillospiraceae bacterium]|nr:MBL fold metallo-hydrolase [Oscillospiraceae bacterium]